MKKYIQFLTLIVLIITSINLYSFSDDDLDQKKKKIKLNSEKIAELIFKKTNEERVKRGLYEYKFYSVLQKIAKSHSENMAKNNFCAHKDYRNMLPQDRYNENSVGSSGAIGENVAMNLGKSEEEAASNLVKAWMNSPGHRENILSKEYSYLGVGVAIDYSNHYTKFTALKILL